MTMRTLMTCAALALSVTAAGAETNIFNAHYMLGYCKTYIALGESNLPSTTPLTWQHYIEIGRCSGVVEGLWCLLQNTTSSVYCIDNPAGAVFGQGVRIVIRYIESKPQTMHEPFVLLAMEAIHEAWPCKNS